MILWRDLNQGGDLVAFASFEDNSGPIEAVPEPIAPPPDPPHPLTGNTEQYIIRAQSFEISATGLKPRTSHFFFYESANASDRCKPFGGKKGDNLITDSSGTLSFTVFVDPVTIVATTGFEQAENLIKSFATAKQVRITSDAGGGATDSYCDSSISVSITKETTTTTPNAIINYVEVPYVAPYIPPVPIQRVWGR